MKFTNTPDVNDAFTGRSIEPGESVIICDCGCRYTEQSQLVLKDQNQSLCIGCGSKLPETRE